MTRNGFLHATGAAIVLGLLAACGGGGGGGDAPSAAPAGTRTQSAIHSVETGVTYNYQVYLPASYAQGTSRYRVVYAADGEYRFPVLADVLERDRREVILVNVWHMGGSRRWIDFTMPGAEAYYRFLTRELIPAIDATYRTDPARRIYSGHSLSGAFAMYALYLERPGQRYFGAFISGDGSFWATPNEIFESPTGGEPAATMERQMFERDRSLPVSLVLAGTTQGNGARVSQLGAHLSSRGYTNLRLRTLTYTNGHLEMDAPSFSEGLAFILEGP